MDLKRIFFLHLNYQRLNFQRFELNMASWHFCTLLWNIQFFYSNLGRYVFHQRLSPGAITWDLCKILRPIQRLLFSARKICWWKCHISIHPPTFPTGATFIIYDALKSEFLTVSVLLVKSWKKFNFVCWNYWIWYT